PYPHTSTFRELKTFPCAGLTGLFALLHAWIAAKQTLRFQRASQIAVDPEQSTCDRKLSCSSLPHNATAGRVNPQIVAIYRLGSLKRLQHHVLQRHSREIIFERPAIDIDLSATRRHTDAGDRRFPATCGNKFLSFRHRSIFW